MVGIVITAVGSQAHWDFIVSNFKPDTIYVCGKRDVSSYVLKDAVEISSSSDLPEDCSIVLLAPLNGTNLQGDEPLPEFKHPKEAIYWFGSDSHHIDESVFTGRAPDHKVFIPTDSNDQMYAAASWAVVAWDRRSKK